MQAARRDFYSAKIEFVNECIGPGEKSSCAIEALCPPQSGIEFRRNIRCDILAVRVAAGERESEIWIAVKVRILKDEVHFLFQQTVSALDRGRLVSSKKAIARQSAKDSWADSRFAIGRTRRSGGNVSGAIVLRRPRLRLKAKSISESPSAGLSDLQQHRLLGFGARGVFDCRIHLIEECEVVEVALRFKERRLIQRVAWMDRNGIGHSIWTCVNQSVHQNLADENLLAFRDMEDNVQQTCVRRLRPFLDLNPCLIKSLAQVVGQQSVPISGQILCRKQLAR